MPDSLRPARVLCDQSCADQIESIVAAAGFGATIVRAKFEEEADQEFDVVILDGTGPLFAAALDRCRQFKGGASERCSPVVILAEGDRHARWQSFEAGVDAHLSHPLQDAELLTQLRSLTRIKAAQDQLGERSTALLRANRRLEYAFQQIDQELNLAQRIQASLLPQKLPSNDRIRCAVQYEVASKVCGDFYDFPEIDAKTLDFYVADAMGHGVPASLLTIYLKKALVTHENDSNGRRLLRPGEILARLNRDLIQQRLSENPFITMAYCRLDLDTLAIEFARAGHPLPIRIPREGKLEELRADGTMLGIFDVEYANASAQLDPGDRLIVYSDGIDAVQFESERQGKPSFLACLELHRDKPIAQMFEDVYEALQSGSALDDDLTMLGIEIIGS